MRGNWCGTTWTAHVAPETMNHCLFHPSIEVIVMNMQIHAGRNHNEPRMMVLADGEPLCKVCAMQEFKQVSQDKSLNKEWHVYMEVLVSPSFECAHCGH
jgi:hypothetical protein